MARAKQNLPRSLRTPTGTRGQPRRRSRKDIIEIAATAVFTATAIAIALVLLFDHTSPQAKAEHQVEHKVNSLLAGIPQHERSLGKSTAPVTLEIFIDLKDPDSRYWFLKNLPAVVNQLVRPGTLKLEYRAYKTNTHSPEEFVRAQTAALAAGAQNKLWNYIDTFYYEQGSEFATYATETYLDNIARQVSGLNIARWHTDRHTGRREEQTTAEDQTARNLKLYVTPSFRIGRTGITMYHYTGHLVIKYKEQHPIGLPTANDFHKAIQELKHARKSPAKQP